mmetsp:Transcript_5260/g.6704  ORF Transcript_5260/g.6704 Transcript_5260/m.6704 type:complete len:242 (+) Transcript_5260:160-885(+)|eukprot:CAMPEP_0201488780 /NCGR_PEP_ID=MMETSP0151_2-20130828/19374_1 /ASSEMBLY_ACC=CAM_ASM_000257 /TAXON_ID=200890 /ORGANISM="Paramoeba atlantica, Strain 621/1 / CCAP 1560/9" /LENGTH=241 /DNA_ID=CAMNT_0047874137 /DNA_START=135 /DNA_END=860 /DNA_ORIENTATION=-
MAQSIITQVSRDGEPAQAPRKKKSCFASIFCCFRGGSSTDTELDPVPGGQPPYGETLLPPLLPEDRGKQCLVLDLDETLVHSSFKPIANADFIIPVEIEDQVHQVYVVKRPGVDHFMKVCGKLFEIVVFTASLAKYADPVLDLLDKHRVVRYRLFRDACSQYKGSYVKDLGRLGRDLKKTIIIDNSPASFLWHPQNAIPIISWFDDDSDTELIDLVPFLQDITKVEDVREVLDTSSSNHYR